MRLSKIKNLCKDEKTIYLTDKHESTGEILQFAGDGKSLYPLRGLPYMDEETLLAVMDIPENDRKKWNVQHVKDFPEWVSTDDVGNDIILRRLLTGITYNVDYAVFELGNTRLIIFDADYLRPLEGDFSIVWRFKDGVEQQIPNSKIGDVNGYVVAKKGMFFEALWMAEDLPLYARNELKMIAGRL